MQVTYIYNSGFLVELDKHILLFDYYQGTIPRLIKINHYMSLSLIFIMTTTILQFIKSTILKSLILSTEKSIILELKFALAKYMKLMICIFKPYYQQMQCSFCCKG